MCGIAGILSLQPGLQVDRARLERLRDLQTHRGPDDAGTWLSADGRIGLAHRRLSIIDLSPSGHQPMATSDGLLQIVFNGEIYNFRDLRRELEALGHRFHSESDTEVILLGYREWGEQVLPRLRGMFAFGLHDARRGETLLARDPLGIKPLYYAEDRGFAHFASEVQALRGVVAAGDVDPEALAVYLCWGSVAAPRTLYRNVRALPAGSSLWIGRDRVASPHPYYALSEEIGHSQPMDAAEAQERIRSALLDSVRCHLVADVEVGSFLSGGVDSTVLVSLMSELHDGPISTVNLAFDVPELDESGLASKAAELFQTRHHTIPIGVEEARAEIAHALASLDQPSIDGVNVYFVSQAAVRAGLKVAVSGVGGDELFGGYASFRIVPGIRRTYSVLERAPILGRALPWAGQAFQHAGQGRLRSRIGRVLSYGATDEGAYFSTRTIFPDWEVRSLLAVSVRDALEAADPISDPARRLGLEHLPEVERVSALQIDKYLKMQLLRDSDAMSMRHSLELRTPLVDHVLLREVFRVPAPLRQAGPAKLRLREACRPPLPPDFWQRKKRGFTLPFDHWLRGGELPLSLPEHPYLDGDAVRRVEADHRAGRARWPQLWALLVLGRFLA